MKQVIAVRTDLKMGKGKLAAQVAHASLASAEVARTKREGWYDSWNESGQPKVVLKVGSEDELNELHRRARAAGLPASLIQDRGLTQLEPGTITCMSIGPAPADLIDKVTGQLKLL
ncbi:MAG: peptidyl-tRNA hydrolase [Thaumarchaeota archaeon]|nr:peptidyl-tRNA hydrolase [Nitrososphaerota archaeon]MBI3023929.1 peptidyl-tRNA hydrolase [Nitrososphaerota archaeon]MBI3116694.1 peptidyl-tRNA hydrolase [Nitrososphaerota archaeon]